MLCCAFENLYPGAPYSSFKRRTFYHISTITPLSGIFVARAMRKFILGDYLSPYSSLPLKKVNSTSLANKRVQNFLILPYKSLFFPHFSAYMKNMFSLRSSCYDLRGNNICFSCTGSAGKEGKAALRTRMTIPDFNSGSGSSGLGSSHLTAAPCVLPFSFVVAYREIFADVFILPH